MATTRDFCLAPARPVDAPLTPLPGRYGRLLPDLPPLVCDDDALLALGAASAVPDDQMADGREEAQARGGGDRLGPVGGRIVAEVLIGIIRADPGSHLAVAPGWRPTLAPDGGAFEMAELLGAIGG